MNTIPPNVKLHRDSVVSIVNGQQLVGVYYYKKRKEGTISKEILVTECSPEKANQLLKKYNT